jgi:hypothetical protein
MLKFFNSLFTRSKNREAIEQQQGTPELQKKTMKLEIFG